MKKIEVELTDEQYSSIKSEIERCSKLNLEEATMSGLVLKSAMHFQAYRGWNLRCIRRLT